MSTSASFDYSINRVNLITAALRHMGAIDIGQALPDELNDHATEILNMMLKNWAGIGINLWRLKECTLLLETDKIEYDLGTSGDNWVETANVNETFVNADQTISGAATAVTVDSTSGMSASDYIGVELEDGSIQWNTIASVDSSTAFTPDSIWTDDVDDDAHVYWYTSKAQRPLWIKQAWKRLATAASDSAPGIDIPLVISDRQRYYRIGDKYTESDPVEIYYDPKTHIDTNGRLLVYPEPNDVGVRMQCLAVYPWEDMDNATDDFGAPQEWYLPIMLGLCQLMFTPLSTPSAVQSRIDKQFNVAVMFASSVDHEQEVSAQMVVDSQNSMR